MVSYYFLIDKSGRVNKLRKALLMTKLNGDRRMVRAYNQHGRESGRVAQVTCDREVEGEFLRLLRCPKIIQLPDTEDPLELLTDNPREGKSERD